MQLRKQNWKRIRDRIPCALCGEEDHNGSRCYYYTRTGKRKVAFLGYKLADEHSYHATAMRRRYGKRIRIVSW